MQLPADCWGSSRAGKDLSSVINIEAVRDRLLSWRPPTRTRVLYSRLSAAHSQLIDRLIATAIPSACCRRIVERGKSGEYRVINGTPPTSRRFEGSPRLIENCVSSTSKSRQFNTLRVWPRSNAKEIRSDSELEGISNFGEMFWGIVESIPEMQENLRRVKKDNFDGFCFVLYP